jgi:hypothetical protein
VNYWEQKDTPLWVNAKWTILTMAQDNVWWWAACRNKTHWDRLRESWSEKSSPRRESQQDLTFLSNKRNIYCRKSEITGKRSKQNDVEAVCWHRDWLPGTWREFFSLSCMYFFSWFFTQLHYYYYSMKINGQRLVGTILLMGTGEEKKKILFLKLPNKEWHNKSGHS